MSKSNDAMRGYVRFSGIALQMVIIIGLGAYGGVKLDEAYPNEHSMYTIICSLAAVGLSMYYVVRQVTKTKKPTDSNE